MRAISKLCIPFLNRVPVSHTHIASSTYGIQVVQSRKSALALWNIVTTFKVKDIDPVLTPRNRTRP